MAVHFIYEHCSYQPVTHYSLATGCLAVLTAADEAIHCSVMCGDFRWISGDQGDVAVPSASRGSDMLRVSRFCSTLSISCVTHHERSSARLHSYDSHSLPPGRLTC